MVCNSNDVLVNSSTIHSFNDPKMIRNDQEESEETVHLKDAKDIDYIYDKIVGGGSVKDFGQWFILLALIIINFISSWPIYIVLFAGFKPRHRCFISNCDTEKTITSTTPDWISNAIPENDFIMSDTCQVEMVKTDEKFDACQKYHTYDGNSCNIESFNRSIVEKCDSYVYDDSVVFESFVTKYDLVCDKEYWARMIRAVMILGLFIGSVIGGHLGDCFGRKRVMLISTIIMIPNLMFSGYSPNLWVYIILFLLNITTLPLIWISLSTLTLELFGKDYRGNAVVAEGLSWCFGQLISVLVFYLTRHWTYLHLWIGIISVLGLPAFLIIPESPRWLITQGKRILAEEVLLKIARWNRRDLSDNDKEEIKTILETVERNTKKGKDKRGSMRVFFTKMELKKTLILSLNWGILLTSYYVLYLSVTELSGNIFINSALLSLLGNFPGKFMVGVTLKHFSRRFNILLYHFLAGSFLMILGLIPKQFTIGVLICFLLSMICIEAGFTAVSLTTRELYPTTIRNLALGFFSSISRIFAITSPFISKLSCIWKPLPMLIISLSFMVVASLSYQLPETKNANLTEIYKEDYELQKSRSRIPKNEEILLNDIQPSCTQSTIAEASTV